MLNRSDLHTYQEKAVDFIKNKKTCGLFIDMGLGKTVTTLTAISDLIAEGKIKTVLIIAPPRVAISVWGYEHFKWDHLKHLTVGIVAGHNNHNRKINRDKPADIYVYSNSSIKPAFLPKYNKYDLLVIDESSSFKTPKSTRFTNLKPHLSKIPYRVILTGTPAPNSLLDLWSQMYIVDMGERLCPVFTTFKLSYFYQSGYRGYVWTPVKGAEDNIKNQIKDVTMSLVKEDYLELPDVIKINNTIELPRPDREIYKRAESKFIIHNKTDDEISADTASVLLNKLLQFCNGNVYDKDKKIIHFHKHKLQMLNDIVKENENENILVAYNFLSDVDDILDNVEGARLLSKDAREVEEWNNGEIKVLLAHPASAGYGLNLQKGGSIIVWYGLTWNLEHYEQFNARLHRQGQTKPVRICHIMIKDSVEEKVLYALEKKYKTHRELMEYLRHKYRSMKIQKLAIIK
ncbi:hypothetical protein AB832_07530 [Flavobacteriaceae bacterium (ex Bugula neritina AB1)]|nr:hypothetical protein AB832_07530 [Flavobacteriaceae bacterium (ex Bugula neritina AB1)]